AMGHSVGERITGCRRLLYILCCRAGSRRALRKFDRGGRRSMYKVGLTGGIGSGKSKVADMLGHWGAAIVDTDVIAHELTAPGGQAIEPIRQHFGPGVISATGALDRQAMRDL